MPAWNDILNELQAATSPIDLLRRKYLNKLYTITGRNVIVYYSSFLQHPDLSPQSAINDNDKNGLMNAVKGLNPEKGLDLILHTQGGDTAATESLVDYLRSVFGTNIRAIIPQIAMSGGTMIACACKSIIMGKQSSLGPYDPQYGGISAHGLIEEFATAKKEVIQNPATIPIWQQIIAKYPATAIGECQKAIAWSETMMRSWLETGMFKETQDPTSIINVIIQELGDHAITLSHNRHLSAEACKKMGLRIEMMENSQKLQDAILNVHHSMMITLGETNAYKLIENHQGKAFVQHSVNQRSK